MNNSTFGLTYRDYLANTFMATGLGIAISMMVSFVFSNLADFRYVFGNIALISMVAELVVAFVFTAKLNTMSKSTAWGCYIAYSVLTGISLSSVFYLYTGTSIATAFVSTVILFVCMAVIGKTTNIDLSRFSGILFAGLLAIIISSFINLFILHSDGVEMVISYVGVVIFLGLVAYDMQRLNYFYNETLNDSETAEKMMIYGAFQLYLDFINLFIRLLRFFGRARNSRN